MVRLSIGLALCLAGCGLAEQSIALTFAGRVGDRPFSCGETYPDVGSSGAAFTGLDFRFYVHDVRLVTEDGEEIAVALTDDDTWQSDEVALIDFESGGACASGNAPTNGTLRGTLPEGAPPIVAVRFRLGVPEHLNHVNAAAEPPPLNVSSLFWGWSSGYDFLRVDGATEELPFTTFVLGATACTGDARMGTRTCAHGNRPDIELAVPSLEALSSGTIVADLAALFSTTDMRRDQGGPLGCMSEASDPECATMFAAVGLGVAGESTGAQRFFRFERGDRP